MNGYNFLSFDVMMGDRYVCTMHMRYCPAFKVTSEEIKRFVENKRPSLKWKNYTIEIEL